MAFCLRHCRTAHAPFQRTKRSALKASGARCCAHFHYVVVNSGQNAATANPGTGRRALLLSSMAAAALCLSPVGGGIHARAQDLHEAGELASLAQLQQDFAHMVALLQQQLGGEFDARLVFYTAMADLPSGIPGDPAQDYSSRRSQACGSFRPGAASPYDICPLPGQQPADPLAQRCCRHFAYAVPRSRLALARADRVHSVVMSPRAVQLQARSWRAMLLHELGHCIDFHVFGGRYGLADHAPASADLAAQLAQVDSTYSDPEARADVLGQLLLGDAAGGQLCYDPETTLQVLLPAGTACAGTGQPGDLQPMLHFSHPPLQGKPPTPSISSSLLARMASIMFG